MDISNIKLPIAIIGIIIAQAFGIIWYVAQLDSTVTQLSQTVEEIRTNTATTSVAVMQNDISNIKTDLEKLEQSGLASGEIFDDTDIWISIGELQLVVEELQVKLDKLSSSNSAVTAKDLRESTAALSAKLQNILDGKGSTWKQSNLKKRIEALEDKAKIKRK